MSDRYVKLGMALAAAGFVGLTLRAAPVAHSSGTIVAFERNALDGALVKAADIVVHSDSYDDAGGTIEVVAQDQVLHASGSVTFTVRNNLGESTEGTVPVEFVPYRGLITQNNGYIQNVLHLGANFDTDDLLPTGIDTDQLSAYGGQAHQMPWPGLVYTGLKTQGSEPSG